MKSPVVAMWYLMWKYAKGHRKGVVFFMVFESISTLVYMLDPYIVGRAFNFVQESEVYDSRVLSVLAGHFLLIFILVLIRWVFWGFGRITEETVAFHIKNAYQLDMIRTVLHLPIEWQQENHSGKTIEKIKRASEALYQYAAGVFELVDAFWKLVAGFLALFLIDWFAGGFSVIVSLIAISVIIRIDKIIAKILDRIFAYDNKTASAVHDFVTNATTVISMKLQQYALDEILKRMQKPFKLFRRKLIINESKWAGVDISITAMIVVAIIVYAFLVLERGEMLLVGTLTMIFTYLNRIAQVFFMTAWRFGQIVDQNARVDAARSIMRAKNKMILPKDIEIPSWKEIKLKNITYSYKQYSKKKKKAGVFGIDLNIRKGQNIAFVGMSGGGKSTVMSLLKGFYAPDSGSIFIDSEAPKEGFDTLYEDVAYVPQHPEIFQNTVKYNVALGKKVSKKEMEDVLTLSHFDEVLSRMKADTSLNIAEKGVTLSGGEKQRLALARGLLFAQDKEIICLDEPTSSVDAKGELKIFKGIFKKFKDKTIIASVHRFHLLTLFDYIYVFKEGKIVGEGSFSKLRRENNEFKHLLKAFKDAEEDDMLEIVTK
jgi:ABC-type multidrug transport system fused ATPase/permease subunit